MKEYTATIANSDATTTTFEVSIPWEVFSSYEEKALKKLAAHLALPGFRKGHIPLDVAKKHLEEELILVDMAELAIAECYPSILKEKNVDAIGKPELSITKIARGNELLFTLKTAILPQITLPDYRTIASGIAATTPADVTDEDINKVIENLRQLRTYGHVHEEGHDHEHAESLPEIDDAFAASFGEFKTLDELKAKIRQNLAKEKANEALDKRRASILDALIEKTDISVPELIVASEQEKLYAQIEMDVSRSGFSMDDYLKQVQKTKEVLMEDFKPEAIKRAKMQLLVNAIAKKESLTATDKEVMERTASLLSQYPEAEKGRLEAYADMVITNEKVLAFLENAGK